MHWLLNAFVSWQIEETRHLLFVSLPSSRNDWDNLVCDHSFSSTVQTITFLQNAVVCCWTELCVRRSILDTEIMCEPSCHHLQTRYKLIPHQTLPEDIRSPLYISAKHKNPRKSISHWCRIWESFLALHWNSPSTCIWIWPDHVMSCFNRNMNCYSSTRECISLCKWVMMRLWISRPLLQSCDHLRWVFTPGI